jgi:GntR family transcriptional repressor for pyruvate dehydrogenase complex
MDEQLIVAPIQRSRLSKQITVQLCRMITQGQLQPGDRLPPERELTEMLQVSRTSLREALRVLEMAGVLTIRQGGGTFVRELDDDGMLSPLLLMFDVRGDLVGDLFEVRVIFEPEMAARAALRATDDHLAELDRILRSQEQLTGSHAPDDAWLRLDRQFHIAVARASHNEVAVRVMRFITEMLQDVQRNFVASDQRVARAVARHREIFEAIRETEAKHARQAMLQHLREVEEFVLQGVAGEGSGDRIASAS